MITLDDELLGLKEIAAACAVGGKKPHISTCYRWMTDGCRGVHLEYIRVGRRPCTTRAALDEFTARLSELPAAPRKPTKLTRTAKQRQRDKEIARQALKRHGWTGGAA